GITLGSDEREAEACLRHLLVELDTGAFKRPSERRKDPLKTDPAPRRTIREACNEFLVEKRQLRGKKTAADYQSRFTSLLAFAEDHENRQRWPYLEDIDRQFALEFRAFLHQRITTRNGHSGAIPGPMSARQIRNVLSCSGTLLNWAKDPQINLLPAHFMNPFTRDVIGSLPKKDPLRPVVFPLEFRIRLVEHMDWWQLTHFSIALVLPLRPEDYTGLLISEVDFEQHMFRFGTRLGGRDFNKGVQEFSAPFPAEIEPLLRTCVGHRSEGPVLQSRPILEGRRHPQIVVNSQDELAMLFDRELSLQPPNEVQTSQDMKRLFRKWLTRCGGVSVNAMSREFQRILVETGSSKSGRFYDLRGSTNTELERAGVSHLVQRYVTGHTTDDILNEYVSLDPRQEMRKYFDAIAPLLEAMSRRISQREP
ncbi:MAG: phage integrase SAM-like domain-containing protein, partial [Planctomycetaceae bacterium]|nr:phage integrase SAM-like domain-containing protein [Planctomycetaceae bacterium]